MRFTRFPVLLPSINNWRLFLEKRMREVPKILRPELTIALNLPWIYTKIALVYCSITFSAY
jgi:hypothetical protein